MAEAMTGGALLIALAGQPGAGKSTFARALARRTGADWLRVDSIEQALRDARPDMPVEGEGYLVAAAVARDGLALGRWIIADCVNDDERRRRIWRDAARATGAPLAWIEIACSDPAEHRRRVEQRQPEVVGLVLPDWAEVTRRPIEPWTGERVRRLDSAHATAEEMVDSALGWRSAQPQPVGIE